MESSIDTTRYYNTLQISKTATQCQIRDSYRRLIRQNQPELGGDIDFFQLIKQAYNVLKDPEKRNLYDRYGETLALSTSPRPSSRPNQPNFQSGIPPFCDMGAFPYFPFGGLSNFMSPPPGSRDYDPTARYSSQHDSDRPKQKTRPIRKDLPITLEDAYKGITKSFRIKRRVIPESFDAYNAQKCQRCGGKGTQKCSTETSPGEFTQRVIICEGCLGGRYINSQVDETKIVQVIVINKS
ncbi:unnamed protein product [Moneuplotes crassus]|uniref:J domain-containing protein n=1 Tax=Euplotes crassus TaxID=5936 RepID=A0AAD1U585_EUPCR|nr:unnamed protein product [Moneuplotes crassus]